MHFHFLRKMHFAFVAALLAVDAKRAAETISRAAIASRAHQTWEGTFAFADEMVVRIRGLTDLHVLVYRCERSEGTLIEIARLTPDGSFRLLHQADTNRKGVTPIFEGIDVLPEKDGAEVLLRWRHPGQGGLRSVDKFIYRPDAFEWVQRSDLVDQGNQKVWVNAEDTGSSIPAKLAPHSAAPLRPPR